jgi:DNA-binding transcriptional regulator/RsmH inhibitor MraZ
MNHPLLEDCTSDFEKDYFLPIRRKYLAKHGLVPNSDCVLVWMSEDCVSLWSAETWNRRVLAKIDALLENPAAANSINRVRTLCHFAGRWVERKIPKRSGITLPEEFRVLAELNPASEREAVAHLVIVDCGHFLELWRPSAWDRYKRKNSTKWDEFWEALDLLS